MSDVVVITEVYLEQPDGSVTRIRYHRASNTILDFEPNFPVVFIKPTLKWSGRDVWMSPQEAEAHFPKLLAAPEPRDS